MWWDIIKRLKTQGKSSLTGFRIEDINEERPEVDDNSCIEELREIAERVRNATLIFNSRYKTETHVNVADIPEEVACAALEIYRKMEPQMDNLYRSIDGYEIYGIFYSYYSKDFHNQKTSCTLYILNISSSSVYRITRNSSLENITKEVDDKEKKEILEIVDWR